MLLLAFKRLDVIILTLLAVNNLSWTILWQILVFNREKTNTVRKNFNLPQVSHHKYSDILTCLVSKCPTTNIF
jgi:hypothetical protein